MDYSMGDTPKNKYAGNSEPASTSYAGAQSSQEVIDRAEEGTTYHAMDTRQESSNYLASKDEVPGNVGYNVGAADEEKDKEGLGAILGQEEQKQQTEDMFNPNVTESTVDQARMGDPNQVQAIGAGKLDPRDHTIFLKKHGFI